jgi:uncharacterized membrane protein
LRRAPLAIESSGGHTARAACCTLGLRLGTWGPLTDEVESPPPPEHHESDALDKTFNVALTLKGIDGALELIGGLILLFVAPSTIDHFARWVTLNELSESPHDFFARHLLHVTSNLHKTQFFGAIYLLSHGAAKIVVVVGLLRREHWAYPVAFVFLGGFGIYQIYRMTFDPSIGLALLTVFDFFILWLTWREFQRERSQRP